eukprot:GFUD01120258.1.p1 GENE.GFUD01120258.1~~GFUD01120258.1.p1  ORF type:complete len:425 (+),score=86.26 GFUD01120258.1:209-1483(+)
MFFITSTVTVLIAVTIQATKGQFQLEQSHPKCGARECVIISGCPAVLKLVFQVKAGDPEAKKQLLTNHCGFENSLPKVCCDRKGDITEKPRIFPNSQTIRPKSAVTSVPIPSSTTPSTTPSTTTQETTPFTTQTTTTSLPPRFSPRTILKEDFSNINSPKCGIRTSLNFRITFGETAAEGQFPWVVSLIYKNRRRVAIPLCGGALVSGQHVITAAHCDASQSGFSLSSVIMGQTDISAPLQLPGLEVDVDKVVRHPQFRRNPVAEMDIAIIKLVQPVTFTDMIRPICLFSPDIEEVEDPVNGLIVAGWGRTERKRSSELLQFTFLDAVPMNECQAVYGVAGKEGKLGAITELEILKSQLCAQGTGATDSCTGDSGGPLMAQVGSTWYLAGVVSFGTQQCDSSLPGVYTRVSHFYSWIQNTMLTA